MDGYGKYLLDRRLATEKTVPFYLYWVSRYRDFFALGRKGDLSEEGLELFLAGLAHQ